MPIVPTIAYMCPDPYPTVTLYAAVSPYDWGNRQWPPTTIASGPPGPLSDSEKVAILRAAGVNGPDALRILTALDWDCDLALLVVREAKADGADPVDLAREVGGKKP